MAANKKNKKNTLRVLFVSNCGEIFAALVKRGLLEKSDLNDFIEVMKLELDKNETDLMRTDVGAIIRVIRSGRPASAPSSPRRVFTPPAPEGHDGDNANPQQTLNEIFRQTAEDFNPGSWMDEVG